MTCWFVLLCAACVLFLTKIPTPSLPPLLAQMEKYSVTLNKLVMRCENL